MQKKQKKKPYKKKERSRRKRMNLRMKLRTVLIAIILPVLLTCCTTTSNTAGRFPDYQYESRIKEENGDIKETDKDGKVVFYYNKENDTVTIPYDYWIRIITYGIDSGGFEGK